MRLSYEPPERTDRTMELVNQIISLFVDSGITYKMALDVLELVQMDLLSTTAPKKTVTERGA